MEEVLGALVGQTSGPWLHVGIAHVLDLGRVCEGS